VNNTAMTSRALLIALLLLGLAIPQAAALTDAPIDPVVDPVIDPVDDPMHSTDVDVEDAADVVDGEESPRVVVAVIDDPLNPYHDWFHADGPLYQGDAPSSVTPELLDELGIGDDQIIRLTRGGTWQENYAADEDVFDAVDFGKLYWYEGTNVIAATFDRAAAIRLLPDNDAQAHGTGTSGAVLAANPDAVIIHVDRFTDTDAELFVADLPAVDILNSSYGFVGGAPIPFHIDGSYDSVVRGGKLHFGAAGNQPTPDLQSLAGGAWWQIGVGGYQEGTSEGQEPLAAVLPDFVGDFSQQLPRCGQCTDRIANYSGTSFSSPRAAGTASAALLDARRAAGHLGGIVTDGLERPAMIHTDEVTVTNWQLRRALEEAAFVPGIADYSPGVAVPINDVLPWPQIGWGLLTPDAERGVVDETVAHLGLADGEPTRTKPADACAFMTLNQESRRAYWNSLPTSDSFGTSDYPYEAC
jgi:hypothetical protein